MHRRRATALIALLALVAGPVSARVDDHAAALKALLDGARASHSDTLRVVRDGTVLADYRKPGEPARGIEMMSATKSLVGLAVGRLITQGRIRSIEQPVSDFYPEWKQGRKAKITLHMLLDHTSGLQNVPNATVEIYPAPNQIRLALAAELSQPPGTAFAYNNKAMNLLAGIIEKASGQRMDRYIAEQLLAPMGIGGTTWNADGFDKAGNPYAMAGWNATAEDAAKVGRLVLDHGRWHGKVLVDPDYISAMVGQSQPFTSTYGLLWWRRGADRKLGISAKAIDGFERAGIVRAPLEKLRTLVSRTFADSKALRAALATTLGADRATLTKDIVAHERSPESLVEQRSGSIVAYEANGYLGQYIVVVPKAHLVAVRQIRSPAVEPEPGQWHDGYDDFTRRVIALARTYTSELAVDTDAADARATTALAK